MSTPANIEVKHVHEGVSTTLYRDALTRVELRTSAGEPFLCILQSAGPTLETPGYTGESEEKDFDLTVVDRESMRKIRDCLMEIQL